MRHGEGLRQATEGRSSEAACHASGITIVDRKLARPESLSSSNLFIMSPGEKPNQHPPKTSPSEIPVYKKTLWQSYTGAFSADSQDSSLFYRLQNRPTLVPQLYLPRRVSGYLSVYSLLLLLGSTFLIVWRTRFLLQIPPRHRPRTMLRLSMYGL